MENKFQIIGNENSVIYYNLNKQFSNVKKIIITKDIILSSFESPDVTNLFQRLKEIKSEEYFNLINQCKTDGVFEIKLKNELHSKIQEELPKLSENMMNVKLKDFNFMNSISNSNLTITLRTENFSISKYYVEKGSIINIIRHLIEEYLFNKVNIFRLNRIDNFQIEIYESEEIYKKVILKKEHKTLQLYSSFGFPHNAPFDYEIGGEFYFSIGEDFSFYQNKQTHALIRDHSKIVEKEINQKEKILENNELVTINDLTKNINDALIELYLNSKGKVKILNVSLLDNELKTKSEDGFIINKSSKNYNKISILNFRDNLNDDFPNPKYMVIKNSNEVKELVEDLTILKNIDGLIFSVNFYAQILDLVGTELDIDILYFKNEIGKTLECDFDAENLAIGSKITASKELNPFNNIIATENKENDVFLEKLKNIDLSTPKEVNKKNEFNSEVSNLAESLMSSSNSSINSSNTGINKKNLRGSGASSASLYDSSGKKKNALAFLMETALNEQPKKEEKQIESNNINTTNNFTNNSTNNFNSSDLTTIREEMEKEKKSLENIEQSSLENDYIEFKEKNEEKLNLNFNNVVNNINTSVDSVDSVSNNDNNNNGFPKSKSMDEILGGDNLNSIDEVNNKSLENNFSKKTEFEISKYENILATNILTVPNINSKKYFVDSNTLSMVNEGEIFYLTTNEAELGNPNLKYVMPIELVNDNLKVDFMLINSTNNIFLLNEEDFKNKNLFINLSKIDSSIKKNFLDFVFSKVNRVSLILLKEDLDLIKEHIHRVENLMVKDIISDDDYLEIEKKILAFEKKYLMNK